MSTLHIITCEYPPEGGGVADYTRLIAEGLAAAGEEVHVWCRSPQEAGGASEETAGGVEVHRVCGGFAPADLRRVGSLLDAGRGPRRLLVQYVPHGFGYRSLNVALCAWLWSRAHRRGDSVEPMVHEPFLAFAEGGVRQAGAALVHRLMTTTLLAAASRVWVSIPAWERAWRPYALDKRVPFTWLPVPCTVPVVEDAAGAELVRARYVRRGAGSRLVGHLGTYGRHVAEYLVRLAPALLEEDGVSLLLLGRGGESVRETIISRDARLRARVHAAGSLAARDLSLHLAACDLLAQPYPDGASSRRTSLMAGLAHGLPIVTTRGRLSEPLWESCGAVALAPADKIDALASSVVRLLGDEEERARLGVAARALYRDRFDLTHTVAALRRADDARDEAADLLPAKVKA